VLLASKPSLAEPLPLDLAAAISMARKNSPLVKAARVRIAEARADVTGASKLLGDNPEVGIAGGPRRPASSFDGPTVDLDVGLSQRFELGGQRRHRIDKARAEVEASNASARDVERVIDLAVAESFFDALGAAQRVQILGQNEQLAAQLLEVARKRLNAGNGTPLDVKTSRVRLAEAKRAVIAARAEHQSATSRLATLVALEPDTALALVGDLPADARLPAFADLVAHAVASRPDLVSRDREINAARAGAALADAKGWPDLTVGLGYGRDAGDHKALIGFSIPLPLFDRNQGEREKARAIVERLAAARAALLLEVKAEVRLAWLALEQAKAALALYDADVLNTQEETLELLTARAQGG